MTTKQALVEVEVRDIVDTVKLIGGWESPRRFRNQQEEEVQCNVYSCA